MTTVRHRRELRRRALLADQIKNLEDEARGIALWLDLYDQHPKPHEEDENTGRTMHSLRYERIIKEIHRLQWKCGP